MVRLLVGIDHGIPGYPAPPHVLPEIRKILDKMKPGEEFGIEFTPDEVEYYQTLIAAAHLQNPQQKTALLKNPPMHAQNAWRSEIRALAEKPDAGPQIRRIVQSTFAQILQETVKRKIRVIGLESPTAITYSLRTYRQLHTPPSQKTTGPINPHSPETHTTQKPKTPQSEEDVFDRWAYALGALREKGFLSRMRRPALAVACLGVEHVRNLRKHNRAQLFELGLRHAKHFRILDERQEPPGREQIRGLRLAMEHGRNRFMKKPVRRLPGSFRKKR